MLDPMGPKVRANLENGIPFKLSIRDSSPNIQLGPWPELVLLWPDNSCLILHLDAEDMADLRAFVAANS